MAVRLPKQPVEARRGGENRNRLGGQYVQALGLRAGHSSKNCLTRNRWGTKACEESGSSCESDLVKDVHGTRQGRNLPTERSARLLDAPDRRSGSAQMAKVDVNTLTAPTELRALLAACPERLRPIVGLAVVTGMRQSEILRLRWLDVDLPRPHHAPPDEDRRRPHRLPEPVGCGRAGLYAVLARDEINRARIRGNHARPGERVVRAAVSQAEHRRFPIPRSASHGRELAPNARGGHSHGGAAAGAQRPEDGRPISAPFASVSR